MKTIAFAFLALFLVQIATSALDCEEGYKDLSAIPGFTKCAECEAW
jgi:hypothetical protein